MPPDATTPTDACNPNTPTEPPPELADALSVALEPITMRAFGLTPEQFAALSIEHVQVLVREHNAEQDRSLRLFPPPSRARFELYFTADGSINVGATLPAGTFGKDFVRGARVAIEHSPELRAMLSGLAEPPASPSAPTPKKRGRPKKNADTPAAPPAAEPSTGTLPGVSP